MNYVGWQAHNLSSDQVHGHSTSIGVCKRLVRVCFEKFFKALIPEKLLLGTDLQVKFHNLTILLKHEAWNAYVLQTDVFNLKELPILVQPWVTKETKPCTCRSICPYRQCNLKTAKSTQIKQVISFSNIFSFASLGCADPDN